LNAARDQLADPLRSIFAEFNIRLVCITASGIDTWHLHRVKCLEL